GTRTTARPRRSPAAHRPPAPRTAAHTCGTVCRYGDSAMPAYASRRPPTVFHRSRGSFDHLVRADQDRLRHLEAERVRRPEMEDQLEFSRPQDGQLGRPGALENP